MKKKIVILGSNSFSGTSTINYFLSKGYSVAGFSRSSESRFFFCRYFENKKKKNYQFQKLDINKNLNKLIYFLDIYKPSYIINFSAQSMVAESWLYPIDWYRTNIIGTIQLLEILKEKRYLKKYIHFSTPEVYGSTDYNISEQNFFNPSTPYAISRAASDYHINLLNKERNFPSIITRASNVYGEFQQSYRIIPLTILKILNKEKLYLHGNGESRRSFIHIDDVCIALDKIIQKGELGQTYHISTKSKISIYKLVEKICNKLNYDISNLVIPSKERIGKDKNYFLNSNKIRSELKWQDKIKIDEGINRVIKWVNLNYNYLKNIDLKYKHKK